MLLRSTVIVVLALFAAQPIRAQSDPQPAPAQVQAPQGDRIARLGDILQIGEEIEIMCAEGIDYGDTLEADLFPGQGGANWRRAVAAIYDAGRMRAVFDTTLAAQLTGSEAELDAVEAFFTSERGQRILALELEARRALRDEATEEAARAAAEDMAAKDDPRLALIRRFSAVNDLVELNVSGGLNANLAFYKGMAEGGAFGEDVTEDMMLADVWAQEADLRKETEDWLFPYLSLAYRPLSDEDMQAYFDFSQTDAGQKMNAAVFAAFDAVFVGLSRDLGLAAAKQMQGEDI